MIRECSGNSAATAGANFSECQFNGTHSQQEAGRSINALPTQKHLLKTRASRVYTQRIYIGGWRMGTARVFRSGNSQAVRLPKQFRLKSKEVEIFRRGDEIVLREKDGTMERAFDLLAGLPEDLAVARAKDRPQKRKGL